MSLLGGGSLIYTPPIPQFERYETTGTWMSVALNEVSYSNDGINWQRADYQASAFYDITGAWVYDGTQMVLCAGDIEQFAFKMTNTNPVTFTQSTSGPNPGANDEFHAAFLLSFGTGGYVGRSTGILRNSGNALDWTEETLPTNWGDIGNGALIWMPEVSLHFALSHASATQPAQYFTSGGGLSWTQRAFPESFSTATGRQQDWIDWLVGNGDSGDPILVLGLQSNGRIYRSVDGITWSLRFDPFPTQILSSIAWNPQAFGGTGAFFAVMTGSPGNPENLLTSADGIFWNPVDPNDLTLGSFSLACDTGKNLMLARSSTAQFEPEFEGGGAWISDDDGATWKEFGDRRGGFLQFIPAKIGPVVNETVAIDTGAISISESRTDPDLVRATLKLPGANNDANQINEQTVLGGTVNLGLWAALVDTLNPFYYEYRLDRISGDAFNDGSPTNIDEWVPGEDGAIWGYFLNSGVETKTFSGTLRIRHKETLVESSSVTVSITATVTA